MYDTTTYNSGEFDVAVATQEAIWKVADDLNAEGVRPTLAAIRKKLGAGSFTTISQAMTEWRRRKEKDDRPVVEPLPTELLNAAHDMVAEICAARLAADQAFVGERKAGRRTHRRAGASAGSHRIGGHSHGGP
jgi:hypothetical protein